ncbi:hypothetical protein BRD56_02335 [Thermoplasmatales archaeon SW_10_69_26]|nr:MAG: hypothetical protein BRD56_02335 [Thermoplasmatales archaeon SW_10_69_26]
MHPAKTATIAIALASAAFAGCLQGTEDPTQQPTEPPTAPGADALDLDPLLDNETDPFGRIHRLNLTEETIEPITPTPSFRPWIVGRDRVVHQYAEDGHAAGIAFTELGMDNSTSYEGSFSDSKDAKLPSADPSGEHVYFSYAPVREDPKIVRRPIEPGGEEDIVAELRYQDQPVGAWAVSSNGSLLAGPVQSGGADGQPTKTILIDISGEEEAETVESVAGTHPRFLPDGTIVFAGVEGALYVLEPASGDVSTFLRPSDHETLHQPTVAGDQVWFHARVSPPDDNRTWEEIRHVSLDGEDPQTVAWNEDYRIGPFDVQATGEALVIDVQTADR